jgi:hypothetical protein
VFSHYQLFVAEVGKRAGAMPTPPSTILMYAPVGQQLLFEFYALVNLARISLDNLRNLLEPTFLTPFGELPKSVTDYTKGTTDCPVYTWLCDQPIVAYLSDLRNCLFHYWSFTTSDNAVVIREGLPDAFGDFADMPWLFRGVFRLESKRRIAVNVLLPDSIFEYRDGTKRLARFTYDLRINILSQSREFLRTSVSHCCERFGSRFIRLRSFDLSNDRTEVYKTAGVKVLGIFIAILSLKD